MVSWKHSPHRWPNLPDPFPQTSQPPEVRENVCLFFANYPVSSTPLQQYNGLRPFVILANQNLTVLSMIIKMAASLLELTNSWQKELEQKVLPVQQINTALEETANASPSCSCNQFQLHPVCWIKVLQRQCQGSTFTFGFLKPSSVSETGLYIRETMILNVLFFLRSCCSVFLYGVT